jgi:hypothetical protein
MDETKREPGTKGEPDRIDIRSLVKQALDEFTRTQQAKVEPAYKTELEEERKRREQLERRVNDLVQENKRSRQIAEEAERSSAIKSELQRLGVGKIELAFKAVKDDVVRAEDGRFMAKTEMGEVPLKEYLGGFVDANPEFLPARIAGGSGISSTHKPTSGSGPSIDIEKIRPGMSSEDMERARQEIARIASQTLRNQ